MQPVCRDKQVSLTQNGQKTRFIGNFLWEGKQVSVVCDFKKNRLKAAIAKVTDSWGDIQWMTYRPHMVDGVLRSITQQDALSAFFHLSNVPHQLSTSQFSCGPSSNPEYPLDLLNEGLLSAGFYLSGKQKQEARLSFQSRKALYCLAGMRIDEFVKENWGELIENCSSSATLQMMCALLPYINKSQWIRYLRMINYAANTCRYGNMISEALDILQIIPETFLALQEKNLSPLNETQLLKNLFLDQWIIDNMKEESAHFASYKSPLIEKSPPLSCLLSGLPIDSLKCWEAFSFGSEEEKAEADPYSQAPFFSELTLGGKKVNKLIFWGNYYFYITLNLLLLDGSSYFDQRDHAFIRGNVEIHTAFQEMNSYLENIFKERYCHLEHFYQKYTMALNCGLNKEALITCGAKLFSLPASKQKQGIRIFDAILTSARPNHQEFVHLLATKVLEDCDIDAQTAEGQYVRQAIAEFAAQHSGKKISEMISRFEINSQYNRFRILLKAIKQSRTSQMSYSNLDGYQLSEVQRMTAAKYALYLAPLKTMLDIKKFNISDRALLELARQAFELNPELACSDRKLKEIKPLPGQLARARFKAAACFPFQKEPGGVTWLAICRTLVRKRIELTWPFLNESGVDDPQVIGEFLRIFNAQHTKLISNFIETNQINPESAEGQAAMIAKAIEDFEKCDRSLGIDYIGVYALILVVIRNYQINPELPEGKKALADLAKRGFKALIANWAENPNRLAICQQMMDLFLPYFQVDQQLQSELHSELLQSILLQSSLIPHAAESAGSGGP